MADQLDSDARESEQSTTPVVGRRSMREAAERAKGKVAATSRTVARATTGPRSARAVVKPLRSAVILTMVAGLIATVGLSSYAAWNPAQDAEALTVEQVAADNAQSLVVASDATTTDLSRDSYSATTAEELEKKKAAEAAAARAAAAAAAASAAQTTSTGPVSNVDLSLVAPGSGEVRWPLDMSQIRVGRGISSVHDGVDLLGAYGTPEFAAAAGTVRVAGWFGGYGQGVIIDSVINGQAVTTTYGHMSTVIATAGQTVSAGQIIGLMGSTGNSTANHLHFEVRVNGGLVDPYAWLQTNAG